jgi:hypothetical protein
MTELVIAGLCVVGILIGVAALLALVLGLCRSAGETDDALGYREGGG